MLPTEVMLGWSLAWLGLMLRRVCVPVSHCDQWHIKQMWCKYKLGLRYSWLLLWKEHALGSHLSNKMKETLTLNQTYKLEPSPDEPGWLVWWAIQPSHPLLPWLVGWHHWCNGHELGQTSGDGEGHRSLACCSPWSCEESDMTWQLNNTCEPILHQLSSRWLADV